VVLLLQLVDKSVEVSKNWLNVLQVVLLESSELLNGLEQLDKLAHSSAEEIKSSKDLVWREIELFTFWHVHESFLGELILLKVSFVKLNAAVEYFNKLIWWILFVIPKNVIVIECFSLDDLAELNLSEVKNVILAVSNHLVGDFSEKTGHSIVGVVVSGDGMDHLDTVHQSWKSLLDGH
jgi:hypothetical protein